MESAAHYAESQRRENLIEHCVISELLQDAWIRRKQPMDILRSEVDVLGFDIILSCNGITRQIQLKSSVANSNSGDQGVNGILSESPSGCVVWVRIHEDAGPRLRLEYWFFGNEPGKPLDDLAELRRAKQSRANAQGVKAERANTFRVTKGKFEKLDGLESLSNRLFGPIP